MNEITIATDERILSLYHLQNGMPRGKYRFIAAALNKGFQYDKTGEPWTEQSVKRKIASLKRQGG